MKKYSKKSPREDSITGSRGLVVGGATGPVPNSVSSRPGVCFRRSEWSGVV